MSREVAIIDGGGANIASLQYALGRLGANGVLTSDPAVIRSAERVILPGVGAAAAAMAKLRSHALDTVIPALTQPVLGICLGMQLLAESSEEDAASCLGVLSGHATKLRPVEDNPVPNMGWCRVSTQETHGLLDGIADGSWFYFVHSYALPVCSDTMATATHSAPFSAIMASGNFAAAQFHPERSSAAGAQLLRNFLEMDTWK